MTNIFAKLGLERASDDHRRVLAVLAFLRTDSPSRPRSLPAAAPRPHNLQAAPSIGRAA